MLCLCGGWPGEGFAWPRLAFTVAACSVFVTLVPPLREPAVDLSAYHADCGITVRQAGSQLRRLVAGREWDRPSRSRSAARSATDPHDGNHRQAGRHAAALLENADPVTFLLVGSRQAPAGRPPGMSVFNVFFDSPATRPFQIYRSASSTSSMSASPARAIAPRVSIGDVTIGPFAGELQFTVYRGASLGARRDGRAHAGRSSGDPL